MDSNDFQQIKDLGFSTLIEKFTNYTGKQREEIVQGIGDDASLYKERDGNLTAASSEIFLEGIHFDVTYTPLNHLGYKLVTAAVSDVYAMNSEPVQILVSLAVPNKYSVQMIEQLYKGIDKACTDYQVQLTGGDTTASHQMLAVSVTVLGSSPKENIILRSGANHEDMICVTGDLGSAIAGLRILMREKKEWQEQKSERFQPELEPYEFVVQRQLVPKARKDFADVLTVWQDKPSSLIDVTQGLIADLKEIAKSSGLGAEIYSPAVPIALETRNVADEMKEDVDKYAFYGGEDFEMLFTLSEPQVEKLKAEFEDFSVIGKMSNEFNELRINTGEDKTIKFEL
ncbi:MAG: thiamine-phosphate kinase [Balneolaceae bacterium]|nr:thiamine-phosphate kinase [Balneolaceae bacterium]